MTIACTTTPTTTGACINRTEHTVTAAAHLCIAFVEYSGRFSNRNAELRRDVNTTFTVRLHNCTIDAVAFDCMYLKTNVEWGSNERNSPGIAAARIRVCLCLCVHRIASHRHLTLTIARFNMCEHVCAACKIHEIWHKTHTHTNTQKHSQSRCR